LNLATDSTTEAIGLNRIIELHDGFLAAAVFVVVFAVIATEKLHKTVIALAGAAVILISGIVSQKFAFEHVDWNVIFLLFGMMIIAGGMRRSGVFQWLAIRSAQFTKGNPAGLVVVLLSLTAVASALLDNVTTVVLIGPLTIFLASRLNISPVPLLIGEILASNTGGMATLIGDPPNLIVGSAAGLSFMDFLWHMAPISVVTTVLVIAYTWVVFRKRLIVASQDREAIMSMDARAAIVDEVLARKSVIVLTITILGFILHGLLHLEPASIALAGASALLVWAKVDPHHAMEDVEWAGLMFFVGLFVIVSGLLEGGVIGAIAEALANATDNDPLLTSISIIMAGGIVSGIVDNIPMATAMVPVVRELGSTMEIEPLWWSLALGADLGGNLTIIGASANVILATLAEREGHKIEFMRFFKHGAIVTIVTLIIASFYVWVRYF